MTAIKLTRLHTKGPIHVNPERIAYLVREGNHTNLRIDGVILQVTETPEEIMARSSPMLDPRLK